MTLHANCISVVIGYFLQPTTLRVFHTLRKQTNPKILNVLCLLRAPVTASGNAPVKKMLQRPTSSLFLAPGNRGVSLLLLACLPLSGTAFAGDWSDTLGSPIAASPILRDIDLDGDFEVLISDLSGDVHLLDHLGNSLPGWPKQTAALQKTSPNTGDIDGDGVLDVVVGDNEGTLHAWDLSGNTKPGFPLELEGTIKSVARMVDVDGDGTSQILVHSGESLLYLVNGNGTVVSDWPIDLQGEKDNFGSWIYASTPTIADIGYDGSPEIFVGSTAKKVHGFDASGTPLAGWPKSTDDWVANTVVVVDLDGDGIQEVLAASGASDGRGKIYAWTESGSALSGFPVLLTYTINASSLAVGDVVPSQDGLEIVSADYEGNVYCTAATVN